MRDHEAESSYGEELASCRIEIAATNPFIQRHRQCLLKIIHSHSSCPECVQQPMQVQSSPQRHVPVASVHRPSSMGL